MSRVVRRADVFWADMLKQVDWYREKAGLAVAEGDVNAIEVTLKTLAINPGLGRPHFLCWRELPGIRSCRVERPYHRRSRIRHPDLAIRYGGNTLRSHFDPIAPHEIVPLFGKFQLPKCSVDAPKNSPLFRRQHLLFHHGCWNCREMWIAVNQCCAAR